MLDHGTGFQVCELVDPNGGQTASQVWSAFERTWIRYVGLPEVLMTDGGPEFFESFERGCEHVGIFQHVCDATSAWQNGRCERHGDWMKEVVARTAREIEPCRLTEVIISTTPSPARIVIFIVGVLSTCQFVLGEKSRIPMDLLSDDATDDVGIDDVSGTAGDADSAAATFTRKHLIRQKLELH